MPLNSFSRRCMPAAGLIGASRWAVSFLPTKSPDRDPNKKDGRMDTCENASQPIEALRPQKDDVSYGSKNPLNKFGFRLSY